jgi:5-methylcytosine-specific restriction enzyme subunit McrC
MSQILLTEYQTTPQVSLTPEQVNGLQLKIRDLRITPSLGTEGHFDLTPASTVGTAVVEGIRVDIRPKVKPRSLFYMMSTPFKASVWDSQTVEMAEASHLVEAFLPSFLKHVEAALSRGPLHRYRSQEDRLPTIRGRILFEQQLRTSPGIPLPVSVRYDDYTPDIEENRVLLAAIRRLQYLSSTQATRQRLTRLDAALAQVTHVPYSTSNLPTFHFDRLNVHYESATRLSLLVLKNSGLEHRVGHQPAVTFLADMNKIFEDFVVGSLRQKLGLSARDLDQGSAHHHMYLDALAGDKGVVRLKPDITWWRGSKCVFVGDVKYKRLTTKGFEHADLYQLLAYLVALDLPSGLLIYPTSEAEPATYQVPSASKEIEIFVLPVDGEPSDIDRAVDHLSQYVSSKTLHMLTTRHAATNGSNSPVHEPRAVT